MRILHTSDWHVGRGIRGRSRAQEHRDVLVEIADVAAREQVDIVLVAGDQFDTAAPSPESEAIVYRALLDLEATGAQVVVLAGNHDNPRRWGAVKPLFEQRGFHLVDQLRRPEDGGVLELTTSGGETARIAAIPWLSQRDVVRSRQLMELDSGTQAAMYGDWVKRIIDRLAAGFAGDTVNVITGHLTVAGGAPPRGGAGERAAHLIFDYLVSPAAFPASAQYVALGHLHRPHRLESPCANVWYSGSPLMLDFGEAESEHKVVMVVEVEAGRTPTVHQVPLGAGVPLRTLRGTLEQVEAAAASLDEAHVRVELDAAPAPGLADKVRGLVPGAVDVRLVARPEDEHEDPADIASVHATPTDLLREYLESEGTDGAAVDALVALMSELMEDLDAADAA
ncbi:MAG: exonuclease SbcCD subunit D [Nitriliruptorales bacterium]|nr:exonuclease SbcCD subunit D [Nitriliruptorales bacterium]